MITEAQKGIALNPDQFADDKPRLEGNARESMLLIV